MGEINMARVDDRLIHGKVMQKWTKGRGTNSVYVVDNATAADDFLKDIYVSTNSTGGLKIKVFSTKEVADEWNKDQFGNDKALIVFKNVKELKESYDNGLPLKEVDVGGAAKKHDTVSQPIGDVSLTQDDINDLKELANDDVEVYFQSVPESRKVNFKA